MAIQWNIIQRRFVDPYSPVDSDNVDQLSKAYSDSGAGRGVTSGFDVSQYNNEPKIIVTKGIALKDYVTLELTESVVLPLSETHAQPGSNYVVLVYRYDKTNPPPEFYIDIIPQSDYSETFHLILATIILDNTGTQILDINIDDREENSASKAIFDTSLLELCDTPDWDYGHGYENHALNILYVKADQTGVTFASLHETLCIDTNSNTLYVNGPAVDAGKLQGHVATDFLWVNGQNGPIANISWNNFKIINLGDPQQDLDAVNLRTLNTCLDSASQALEDCLNQLHGQVDTNTNNISNLCNGLNTERQQRIAADQNLQNQINNLSGGAVSKFLDLNDTPTSYGPAGSAVVSTGNGLVFCNLGTNQGVSTFTDLQDTPASYNGASGYLLCVTSTEDGVAFVPAGCFGGVTNFLGLTDTPGSYSGADGYIVTVDGTNNCLKFVPSGCFGGVSNFLGLTDTPGSYSGADGYIVTVDGVNNCLIFTDPVTVRGPSCLCDLLDVNVNGVGGGCVLCFDASTNTWVPGTAGGSNSGVATFTDLTDTPADYSGWSYNSTNGYGVVVVNCTGTGLEFVRTDTLIQSAEINLNDLEDFCITNPQQNDIIVHNGSYWENQPASNFGGNGAATFLELTDTPTSYCNGYLLMSTANGICYVDPATVGGSGGASDLNGLCDVVINNPQTHQVITYNGSSWVNDFNKFIYLADTPNVYTQGLIGTNSNNTGIEFKSYCSVASCLNPMLSLEDLLDTSVLSKDEGYVLTWCASLSKWVAKPVATSDDSWCHCVLVGQNPPSNSNGNIIYFVV